MSEGIEVDHLKKRILDIVKDYGNISPGEMASMLNSDEDTVSRLLREMWEEGWIVKYQAVVNWEKAGEEKVEALIDVKVTPQREVGFDKVAERIYRFPEVKSLYLMSGAYDLSVLVEGKTLKDVALFVAEKLAPLDCVASTTTHFILKKYKEAGVMFDEKREDRRLVLSV